MSSPMSTLEEKQSTSRQSPDPFIRAGISPNETISETLQRLKTSATGLSTEMVTARQLGGVSNEIRFRSLKTRVGEVLRVVFNPLNLVLLCASTMSAFLGETTNALIIFLMVFLGSVLNFWQTFRSERAVKHLQTSMTTKSTVRRNGSWVAIPRTEITLGDIISLSAGDLVPADARLLEERDLHVQQAALTGESLPVEKEVSGGGLQTIGPESSDLVYLGTSIVSGAATAVVFAIGTQTAFGDIVARLSSRPDETEFERGIGHFGKFIFNTTLFLVLFILVITISTGRDSFQSLLFAVALAVGLTPEFLPMITTVTLGQGALQMAKEKVIVKHLSSIQNLGSMNILCSDKTGTLTKGVLALAQSLDGLGQPSQRTLFWGLLNSRFENGIKSPIDTAILEHAQTGVDLFSKVDEVPFDFDRRRLSVAVQNAAGECFLISKGAPESIIETCDRYEHANKDLPLDDSTRRRALEIFQELSSQGYRVIALAYKHSEKRENFSAIDESHLTLLGFLTFADPLIDGVKESLMRLQDDGVQVKILTGDNEWITKRICTEVGITTKRLVRGEEIELMDEMALAQIASQTQVFARVSPSQKHRIIKALKSAGHVVGFLGDGINDAPSLHGADVGISVASAVDVARESSDIILLERRLDVLHAGIIAGRRSFANVLKYILMGTSSNFGNMLSMALATLFLPFLPMLPTQILLNNFLYDLSQITIPSDRVDPFYLNRPHRWNIGLIRRFMLGVGPVSSLFDFLTFYTLLQVFHYSEEKFHTGWFIESLTTQTLVLFVIRTAGRPWVERPSIALAITTIAITLIGIAIPYTLFAPSMGFVPLGFHFFVFLFIVVSSYLAIVEVVKGRVLTSAVR